MSENELIQRRLDIIQQTQVEIQKTLTELRVALDGFDPTKYIDSLEVMKILKMSPSTLYRKRKSGKIIPRLIGGTYLYYTPEIFEYKSQNPK